MKIKEDLPIKRLRGDKLLLRRIPYPKKTDAGIILPDTFQKLKENVHEVHDLPKFQNRGEIIAIGDKVEEGIFELGDIVHFQHNYYQMAIFDKADIGIILDKSPYIDNAEVLLDATNGIDWIEKVELKTSKSV